MVQVRFYFVVTRWMGADGNEQVMNDYATSPDGLAFAGASGETPPMMAVRLIPSSFTLPPRFH